MANILPQGSSSAFGTQQEKHLPYSLLSLPKTIIQLSLTGASQQQTDVRRTQCHICPYIKDITIEESRSTHGDKLIPSTMAAITPISQSSHTLS